MSDDLPPNSALGAIDRFADSLGTLLEKRALSLSVVDVGVDVDGWHIDCELLFATGPDMGMSIHTGAGVANYCVLVGDEAEEWLEHVVENLPILEARGDEERTEIAVAALTGLLDARRPLLKQADA